MALVELHLIVSLKARKEMLDAPPGVYRPPGVTTWITHLLTDRPATCLWASHRLDRTMQSSHCLPTVAGFNVGLLYQSNFGRRNCL